MQDIAAGKPALKALTEEQVHQYQSGAISVSTVLSMAHGSRDCRM